MLGAKQTRSIYWGPHGRTNQSNFEFYPVQREFVGETVGRHIGEGI